MKIILGIAVWYFWIAAVWAQDDRFWVDAEINGKPARLLWDTGAETTGLYPEAVKRLQLETVEPIPDFVARDGKVGVGETEDAELKVFGTTARTSFKIFPRGLHAYDIPQDGILGWPQSKDNILLIEAATRTLKATGAVAEEAGKWTKFRVLSDRDDLALEIPGPGTNRCVVLIDTGANAGVVLNFSRWWEWAAGHPHRPKTLISYSMLGADNQIQEESWADEITLGSLVLTDVPVRPANSAEEASGSSGYAATLGMAALKRLDLVIDGKNGVAYVRPKRTPAAAYQHNRLGAVFSEEDPSASGLIAQVAPGSPADRAGIRDGDVLLKVNEHSMADLNTDTFLVPLVLLWDRPAGTKFELTLLRGTNVYDATVVLMDILGRKEALPVPAEALASETKWLTELGDAAVQETNYEQAINNYTEVIRLNPGNAEAFDCRGGVYFSKGSADLAVADFSQAIKLDPKDVAAHAARAFIYYAVHDFAKAAADFDEVAVANPTNGAVFVDRGLAYAGEGKQDKAIADFTEAIRLNASNTLAVRYRGDARRAKKDYAGARSDYKQLTQMKPGDPEGYCMLAEVLASAPDDSVRDGKEALKYARKACELASWKDALSLDALAMACAEDGNYPDAIKWEQTCLSATLPAEVRTAAGERLKLYQQNKPYRESGP